MGAQLLIKTVKGLAEGNLKEIPQAPSEGLRLTEKNGDAILRSDGDRQTGLKLAPKIFTETCQIDFTKTVDEVFNLVRGLSPYPAAFTFLKGKKLKVYKAEKVNKIPKVSTGELETDGKTFLNFACSNGCISILDLQLEGKKRMEIKDFLRGYWFE